MKLSALLTEGFLLKSRVLIHEFSSPCKDDAGSTCNTLGLRYWNSDDEKTPPPQAVPHPFAGVTCYTALQTDILYIHIYSRFVEPNIFTNKISN